MTIATMKLALEALEQYTNVVTSDGWFKVVDGGAPARNAIAALRAAIEQAQAQVPVAWVYPEGLEALKGAKPWVAYGSNGDGPHSDGVQRIPLYLNNDAVAPRVEPRASESGAGFESLPASPQWHELTDEEIQTAWASMNHDPAAFVHFAGGALWAEARMKEKNT